jgi:chemotaxis protein CheX
MQDKDIHVFLESIQNYFRQSSGEEVRTGTPYVKEPDEKILMEYTGLIGISGHMRGCVYFTTSRKFVEDFTRGLLEEDEIPEAAIRDMIGEIANNIAGNASETFQSGFLISVPAIVTGDPATTSINLEIPAYVIAIEWRGHQAYLVIGISAAERH